MLNIGKLRKGGENYYLNSVARGVEDYYLGSGEAPGYWLGSGAGGLGLSGEVRELELRRILLGRDSASGEPLVRPQKGERVPGFDLAFRAPKSVSLLHALGPKEASNEVVDAHNAAVTAALDYLERHASRARRGRDGRRAIASKGFIAAAFRHRTSRSGDPLLHTHVLVANLIRGSDGSWGAVDARRLYTEAKTAGFLYQAHLRDELSRRLGVEWTAVRSGVADIAGIHRNAIKAFSRRRKEIEERTELRGKGSGRAAQIAALVTRTAKDYSFGPEELLPEWRTRAAALGFDDDAIRATLRRATHRAPTLQECLEIERELAAPDGLTAQRSTFGRRDVIQAACTRLQAGAKVTDVEALAHSFLSSEYAIPLVPRSDGEAVDQAHGSKQGLDARADSRYSTAEMLATERAVIERATTRRLEGAGIADTGALDRALSSRPSLYADQREMVTRLTTSGFGVEVVVGKAGAGKTFALDAGHVPTLVNCSDTGSPANVASAGPNLWVVYPEEWRRRSDRRRAQEGAVADNVVV